jgi:hypothetical protein
MRRKPIDALIELRLGLEYRLVVGRGKMGTVPHVRDEKTAVKLQQDAEVVDEEKVQIVERVQLSRPFAQFHR